MPQDLHADEIGAPELRRGPLRDVPSSARSGHKPASAAPAGTPIGRTDDPQPVARVQEDQ